MPDLVIRAAAPGDAAALSPLLEALGYPAAPDLGERFTRGL